jgi:hypothetical protein
MAETTETKPKPTGGEGEPGADGATQGGEGGGQQTPPGEAAKPKGSPDQQAAEGQQAEPAEQTAAPAIQAKGMQVKLTQQQIDGLLKDGTLELREEQFSGAVRERMGALTSRAKAAERQLQEIAKAQEEADRKALMEQEKYKELYEKEHKAREKDAAVRKDDLVRSRFLLAAQSKGIIDPDVAFVIAKGLPSFKDLAADDEGAVAGLDAVIETLVSAKPYLISQQPGGQPPKPPIGGPSNPGGTPPAAPKNLAEAGDRLEQALRTGIT